MSGTKRTELLHGGSCDVGGLQRDEIIADVGRRADHTVGHMEGRPGIRSRRAGDGDGVFDGLFDGTGSIGRCKSADLDHDPYTERGLFGVGQLVEVILLHRGDHVVLPLGADLGLGGAGGSGAVDAAAAQVEQARGMRAGIAMSHGCLQDPFRPVRRPEGPGSGCRVRLRRPWRAGPCHSDPSPGPSGIRGSRRRHCGARQRRSR